MIEFSFLLVIVLLLYLVECGVWVPAGSVAFRLPTNPKRPLRMISRRQAAARSSIVFANPFSVGGGIIVCPPLPVWISPQGVVVAPSAATNLRSDSAGRTRRAFISFDDMNAIEVRQKNLCVNGEPFVSTASEFQAAYFAELLKALRKKKAQDRAVEIERKLTRWFDADRAAAHLEHFSEKVLSVGMDSLALLLGIFVVMPVVVWRFGLVASWPFLLLYLVLHVAWIGRRFRRAHRDMLPLAKESRWSAMMMVLLSPPAALRATKYLAKGLAGEFQALAVAAARDSAVDFQALASWTLRDATFGADMYAGENEDASRAAQWFRERLRAAVVALIREKGCDPEALIAPPPRESDRVQTFCPRCWSQYVVAQGTCTDCGGIVLRPFPKITTGK
ncbi:MAG: hypothetical protein WBP79_13215 [Candidatus Acidiferrales bacterium]